MIAGLQPTIYELWNADFQSPEPATGIGNRAPYSRDGGYCFCIKGDRQERFCREVPVLDGRQDFRNSKLERKSKI